MKRTFLLLVMMVFILSLGIAFADNSTDVYVSNEGSDSLGNGSIENPYQTLNYTIEKSQNNSNIYLESGVYSSTGYDIINKCITITGLGDVTVDGMNGEVSQKIFNIHNGSSLVLNNIKFINGYADLEGSLSPILNEGELRIVNCNFYNFTTINGAIFNKNSLTVDNVSESKLIINWKQIYGDAGNIGFAGWIYEQIRDNPSRGEFITNIGDAYLSNSRFPSTVYNNRNMNVYNSYLEAFISNRSYDLDISSVIDSSKVMSLRVSNNKLLVVNNSFVDPQYDKLYYTTAVIQNSTFFNDSEKGYFSFHAVYSDIKIKSSSFNKNVHIEYSNMTITYSTILGSLTTGYDCYVNANYNWWGDNKGPRVNHDKYSTMIANYWIVMTFNKVDESNFIVGLINYTNGLTVWGLPDLDDVNTRSVTLKAESGRFRQSQVNLEKAVFNARLIGNDKNTLVYAKIDNQLLRVVVGEGFNDYSWYVSNNLGNDYFCDGSLENPYKTLSKALSVSAGGNTIYVLEGNYTLSWNANLPISKNITFVGVGNAVLERPNARNIFRVDEMGILNIDNLNFTTATQDFHQNPLFYLNGGEVHIKNSNFYNISYTTGIIFSDKSDLIHLDNVTFKRFSGPAIRGNSSYVCVNNSEFSDMVYGDGLAIRVKSDIDILNSIFENNKVIFIFLEDRYQNNIVSTLYMCNTTVCNNDWSSYPYFGINLGTYHSNRHAILENCSFINNRGHLAVCDSINNCIFINNTDVPFVNTFGTGVTAVNYYEQSLIDVADLINNSYFYGNSLHSRSYEQHVIKATNVYNSVFINNKAAYGGALSEPKEVHCCVFLNNTGIYGADDIFVYKGWLNASGNWWGSNQKPDKSRVEVFIGDLIVDNWVIMNLTQESNYIIASLNTLLDDNKTFTPFNHVLPSRHVTFTTDDGKLTPNSTDLVDNYAYAILVKDTNKDFDVYAQIDNQKLSLTVYNNSTEILIDDVTLYGKDNNYKITLINVNGHKISNQLLEVIVTSSDGKRPYTLTTDSSGVANLNIDYSIGMYNVEVTYYGNGYFEKSSARAVINVSSISTSIYSHDYTYWGKNNKFYAILTDAFGRHLMNKSLVLKVFDLKDKLLATADVMTGSGGRADALLSFDIGDYKVRWEFSGDEWYTESSSVSLITIKPINTTLTLLNSTFYGRGNDYEFTLTDIYGNKVSNETVTLKISNGTDSRDFKVEVENGVGLININLLPGIYDLKATYIGDEIYGPSNASAVLDIQKVFLTFNSKSYTKIPENGVFTVILKDMYGKRVSGENVSLELYDGGDLYKTYYSSSDANGEAYFKIDAPESIYFAILDSKGSTWYRQAKGAATVEVSHNVGVGKVYLNASDYVAYYGENKYYTIFFNDTNKFSLEGMKIPVIISSGDFSKAFDVESDAFGNVRLQITLEPGVYDITYKYENEFYNIHDSKTNKITIFKMPTSLIASDVIVKQGSAKNFEVKLVNKNGVAISNLPVTIKIDGVEYNASTNNFGIAKIPINLDLGYHNVNCLFDNVNYIASRANATILVVDDSKIVTSIESGEVYASESSLVNYTITLLDALDNPIKSSQIILNVTDGENNFIGTYETYTNGNGEAKFNLNLGYGVYQAKTYYGGNNLYFESFNTNYIYVSPLENVTSTILFGSDTQIVNGNNDTYSVVLKTQDGKFVCNASIEFIVNGHSYFSITNEKGIAYLTAPFKAGSYEVRVKYAGSNNLTRAYVTNYINVVGDLLYMYSQNVVKSYNNGTHYYVALFDALGHPLVGKTIEFNIFNDTIESVTDEYGFALFEVWFSPGEYNITATYRGDYPEEHMSVSNNITVLATILSENITKYYDGSTMIFATFFDFNGEALTNQNVILNINGINYKVKTDKYGFVSFDVNLASKNYNLTILNTLTGEVGVYNVNVLSTLKTTNMVKYYKGSEKFKATFKDKNGNLLKNTKVKFKLNGKTYAVKTNANGVASLSVNLKPGKYIITTLNTKTSQKNTNQITIKKTIITKNKNVKASKKINFQAKIIKSNGKIAKKVVVKFKVNMKTYKVKTNAKGIAKLNIKLKKGTYTVSTTYNGLTVKNKVRCS